MRPLKRQFDAAALRHNWRAVRRGSAARQLLAVVKSYAYGHGLRFVAAALHDLADGFGVVETADAEILRDMGITQPILLMSGVFEESEMARVVARRLWVAAHNAQQVRWLINAPAGAGLMVFVKVDSGMNRLGFLPDEAAAVMESLTQAPAVAQVALMGHFADADMPGGVAAPLELLQPLRLRAAVVSLGNSAAALLHGDIGNDWGRVGIALYGSSPAPLWRSREALQLRSVMTFKTALVAVRTVRAGAAVGYGSCWCAAADTRIGIAACGYGDGYPRTNHLWARVGGGKAAVLGRVSMELTALDLSGCAHADIGEEVICWGESPSIDEVAAAAGRSSYELLTAAGYAAAKP